jgi:hypothetical protein
MSSNEFYSDSGELPQFATEAEYDLLTNVVTSLRPDLQEKRTLSYGFDGSFGASAEIGWRQDGAVEEMQPVRTFVQLNDADDKPLLYVEFDSRELTDTQDKYVEEADATYEKIIDNLLDLRSSHSPDSPESTVFDYLKTAFTWRHDKCTYEELLAQLNYSPTYARSKVMFSILDITTPDGMDAEADNEHAEYSTPFRSGDWEGCLVVLEKHSEEEPNPVLHIELVNSETGEAFEYDEFADGTKELVEATVGQWMSGMAEVNASLAESITDTVTIRSGEPLLGQVQFMAEVLASADLESNIEE